LPKIITTIFFHRCFSEYLKNSTIDEIRDFHEKLPSPSCTNVDGLTGMQYENAAWDLTYYNDVDPSENRLKREMNSKHVKSLCKKWVYDYDFLFGYRSMTSELNWVCHDAWKSIMGQSTYFIGSVIGIYADIIGRLPVLIIAHLFGIIGNALTIFAYDEISFAFCRFISGLATDSNFSMMYILVIEYLAPHMRTTGLNLSIGVFYCLGSVISPWVAVLLGNYKLYLIATIVPALIVPIFYCFGNESAQYLISKNQLDEALICYQRIAKFNRKELDEHFISDFKNCVSDINAKRKGEEKNPSFLALFKTPRLRRLTLILFFKS
jgi:MFS transporter, OCT family, solute carrier family 22 (organic cation transporter), member 4/5